MSTIFDRDGDNEGLSPADDLGPDAALIARLRLTAKTSKELQAAARIEALSARVAELEAALSLASRRQIEAARDAQVWADSDAEWSKRAQKAEARLARVREYRKDAPHGDQCATVDGADMCVWEQGLDALLDGDADV